MKKPAAAWKWSGPDAAVVTSVPPTVDDEPEHLEHRRGVYPDHNDATSFVISGPLKGGGGPGRRFGSIEAAERWVLERYGDYLSRIVDAEPGGRWAFRVRRGDGQRGDR